MADFQSSDLIRSTSTPKLSPFKFTVVDASGVAVTNLSAFSAKAVAYACGSAAESDPIETCSTGSSGLQNLGEGRYQFNFKTLRAWGGSCRVLGLELGTGVSRTANFQFRRE